MSVEGDTTMLYYSIDHPDPDNNFTVVLINGAGPGEDATTLFAFGAVAYNDTKATCMMCTEDLLCTVFQTKLMYVLLQHHL